MHVHEHMHTNVNTNNGVYLVHHSWQWKSSRSPKP